MSERKTFKKLTGIVTVKYHCNECKDEMISNGVCLTLVPPFFLHKCKGCGKLETLKKSYPHTYLRVKE